MLNTEVSHPIRNDSQDYFAYAYNLATYGTYSKTLAATIQQALQKPPPDALRRPGYPLFLSLIYSSKHSLEIFIARTKMSQVVLSALSLLIIYAIAKQQLGYSYAIIVLMLTSFSPHLLNMNVYLLSETFFTFVQLLLFWCIANWHEKSRWQVFVTVGLLLAVAALTRAWIQYFFVVLILWMHYSRDSKFHLSRKLLVTVGFLALFSVWTIRNITVLGIAADNTLMINSLHHGMYPHFMLDDNPETKGYAYLQDPRSAEINQSVSSVLNEIHARFETDFWRHLNWYTWEKTFALLGWANLQGIDEIFIYPIKSSPYYKYDTWKATRKLMKTIHIPLMILAVFGCMLVWLPGRFLNLLPEQLFFLRLISLLCGYFVAVHAITSPFPRYAIPLRPFFYLMALLSLKLLIGRFNESNRLKLYAANPMPPSSSGAHNAQGR